MFYKSLITGVGLTFASTAFSTQIFNTDEHNELLKNPDMTVNLQLSGYDLSNRKQLDSLCGPGRFVGGGFSHSPLSIREFKHTLLVDITLLLVVLQVDHL